MMVCVNIAADGIESEMIKSACLDSSAYRMCVKKYVLGYLDGTNVRRMFYNVAIEDPLWTAIPWIPCYITSHAMKTVFSSAMRQVIRKRP